MVHRAVPGDALAGEAERWSDRLAEAPTVALGLTKWLLHAATRRRFDEQLRNEAFAMELSSRSEDFREGLAAFVGKRPPEFTGR